MEEFIWQGRSDGVAGRGRLSSIEASIGSGRLSGLVGLWRRGRLGSVFAPRRGRSGGVLSGQASICNTVLVLLLPFRPVWRYATRLASAAIPEFVWN